jgi:hypothetical protein
VPGGAGGQPVAFEQQDVDAEVRQVIADRGADDAAAHHHHLGALRQVGDVRRFSQSLVSLR